MIYISDSDKDCCGSGRFTFALFDAMYSKLVKNFDSEQMQDFRNGVDFHKAIWLDELNQNDFNLFAKIVSYVKLDKVWQDEHLTLIEYLKADPRYQE